MKRLFPQNVIAVIWDFDRTLSRDFMQEPLFARYGVDADTFWQEVRALPERYRAAGLHHVSADTMYLNHLLTYAETGRMPDLDNAVLRESGAGIGFFPGLPACLETCRAVVRDVPRYRRYEVRVEHFVVSAGLREMIMGSSLATHLDGVWACEFIERPLPPGFLGGAVEASDTPRRISQIGYVIDNTTKTRAIFEINKGSNADPDIDVNDPIAAGDRRIPFEHMIYLADGPSDVPVFSLIRKGGGHTCAVYRAGDREHFRKANELLAQDRVDTIGPADYRPGQQTVLWLEDAIARIADRICERRSADVAEATRKG